MTRIFHWFFMWKMDSMSGFYSVLCLHYRPVTVHCSTKDAYTSEITFLALNPCPPLYLILYLDAFYISRKSRLPKIKNSSQYWTSFFWTRLFLRKVSLCRKFESGSYLSNTFLQSNFWLLVFMSLRFRAMQPLSYARLTGTGKPLRMLD